MNEHAGFAGFLESVRPTPGEGMSLEDALSRQRGGKSWWDADDDPERAAAEAAERAEDATMGLVIRRYSPGAVSDLSQRLDGILAELAARTEAREKALKAEKRLHRMYESGQLSGWDFGQRHDALDLDTGEIEKLERRAEHLRQQIADESAKIPAPQRTEPASGIEAASRHAREVTGELARAVKASRPQARPRFARGGAAVRSESCIHCIDQGVDDETSYLLHSDPELSVPVTAPGAQAAQAQANRLMALGYSAEAAQYAASPGPAVRRYDVLGREVIRR
jgi:hypothetical protein